MGYLRRVSDIHGYQADFRRESIPSKAMVLDFMKRQDAKWHTGALVTDQVSSSKTSIPLEAYEVDGWAWDSNETLMFERYDLKLNPDFVDYVLSLQEAPARD